MNKSILVIDANTEAIAFANAQHKKQHGENTVIEGSLNACHADDKIPREAYLFL